MPRHVLNVAVQAHAGIEEHGDGRPRPLQKAALEKAVHGCTGLSQARGIGDTDHAPVPEQAQRGVSFVSPRPHGPGAPPVLPAGGPQVQQLHEIGFGGLLRDVSTG